MARQYFMTDFSETPIKSDHIFDGKLLQVYRDMARLPDGSTSVREWIDHPGASAVVPVFEDGDTLLVRQFRYPARRSFWEIPAGKVDRHGEQPEEVAARELEEETGWKASRFIHLISLFPCIGYSNEIIHLFLADGLKRGRVDLSDGEIIETRKLPLSEAVEMVYRKEILDMKTVVGLILSESKIQEIPGSTDSDDE